VKVADNKTKINLLSYLHTDCTAKSDKRWQVAYERVIVILEKMKIKYHVQKDFRGSAREMRKEKYLKIS
jgi:hypothetical protein